MIIDFYGINSGGGGGTVGPQGPQGERGADGTSVEIKPSKAECVEIGDGYIDENGHLNIRIGDGPNDFQDVGEIRGPQGLTGPAGADGNDGATGAQGPKGATGDQGPAGADGNDGATGAQGPKGDTGAQGPAGGGAAQVQANWDETDDTDPSYIRNKPVKIVSNRWFANEMDNGEIGLATLNGSGNLQTVFGVYLEGIYYDTYDDEGTAHEHEIVTTSDEVFDIPSIIFKTVADELPIISTFNDNTQATRLSVTPRDITIDSFVYDDEAQEWKYDEEVPGTWALTSNYVMDDATAIVNGRDNEGEEFGVGVADVKGYHQTEIKANVDGNAYLTTYEYEEDTYNEGEKRELASYAEQILTEETPKVSFTFTFSDNTTATYDLFTNSIERKPVLENAVLALKGEDEGTLFYNFNVHCKPSDYHNFMANATLLEIYVDDGQGGETMVFDTENIGYSNYYHNLLLTPEDFDGDENTPDLTNGGTYKFFDFDENVLAEGTWVYQDALEACSGTTFPTVVDINVEETEKEGFVMHLELSDPIPAVLDEYGYYITIYSEGAGFSCGFEYSIYNQSNKYFNQGTSYFDIPLDVDSLTAGEYDDFIVYISVGKYGQCSTVYSGLTGTITTLGGGDEL